MTSLLVRGDRLFDGDRLVDNGYLVVAGDRVVATGQGAASVTADEQLDLGPVTIIPGLVDLQVNGGGGVLFDDDPTIDAVRAISDAHARHGTTSIVPTLIGGSVDDLRRAVQALAAASSEFALAVPAVHAEGPFLSVSRRGMHDPASLREPSDADMVLFPQLAGRFPLILTVAPEVVGTERIRSWVDAGVTVWIGHSNADWATARAALDAGASSATHLFNAMSDLTAREAGVVGAILADPQATAGLIMDGVHVHPTSARAAFAALGERLFLVSDCLPPAAGGPPVFHLGDTVIRVHDGACRDEHGTLAGAAVPLLTCVAVAVRAGVLSFREAVRAATVIPARVIGNSRIGRLTPGCAASLVAIDDDLQPVAVLSRGTWAVAPRWSA